VIWYSLQVVSRIDIYSQVGSNQPLIISDLQASVVGDEGLSIRFEGVLEKPIVCGISIRSCSSAGWLSLICYSINLLNIFYLMVL